MLKDLNWTNLELRAYNFAKTAHAGQKRKSGGDFIEHPILVATLLKESGLDEYTVASGFLHDTVEDTSTELYEIYYIFGKVVGDLVASNNEDKSKSWIERKLDTHSKIPFLSFKERCLLIADKYANMITIREELKNNPENTWNLFNAGYESQRWYYLTIAYSVYVNIDLKDVDIPSYFDLYKNIVEEIFI